MDSARSAPLARTEVVRAGGLVDRALLLLDEGPMPTQRLAEEVLALRGNPRAAAAAVFALLGSDARVRVDGAGIWSLAAALPSPTDIAFTGEDWSVVDVETTGGSPNHGHRVIEIGIVRVVGGQVKESYSSLVDPGRRISGMITSITGITNEMVAGAPRFEEIAGRVAQEVGGRVFVGHNAVFDWRFVSAELERSLGRTLQGRHLCTLRLARRLLPNLPSRSLGALAHYFGIEIPSRHRALDDARATAEVLLRLLEVLAEDGIMDWRSLESFLGRSPARRPNSASPRSMESA